MGFHERDMISMNVRLYSIYLSSGNSSITRDPVSNRLILLLTYIIGKFYLKITFKEYANYFIILFLNSGIEYCVLNTVYAIYFRLYIK